MDTMPVYGVGENPVFMNGCLEVELHIPGVIADEDPPLKVIAYVSPPPGGNEYAPMIVGSNVEAVEAAFILFLQPQQGTPLPSFPVAPELQNICQIFAPDLPGVLVCGKSMAFHRASTRGSESVSGLCGNFTKCNR